MRIKSKRKFGLKSNGFTLIELVLYVSILAVIVTAFATFAWNSIETSVKSTTQQEINASGRYISERIKYEIRNAQDINSVTSTSISLATSTPSTNPTIIDLNAGNIRIKQGTGGTVNLNSSNSDISSLVFTNYTSGDQSTKHIQFIMTIDAKFNSIRQEYQGSMDIQGSAELRSN